MIKTSIIGGSAKHRDLIERLAKVASTDAEILISGPSGVGKELYARYIHECSQRNKAAFIAVNCGALPVDLLENELFGHIGGAFTGARPKTDGLVSAAEGGILFLDEVDTLASISQVKLLRFLQEKEYRRLGETHIRRANVRIVAATNCDLLQAVRHGTFREDLFFRLRVVPVDVPSLRERREDIPLLIAEFASRFAQIHQLPKIRLAPPAMEKLKSYIWPGNIRELENCINYLTCSQFERPVQPSDLPLLEMNGSAEASRNGNGKGDWHVKDVDPTLLMRPYNEAKRDLVDHFEREYIEDALRRSNGNIGQAARESRKPRRVFFELMRKHGIKVGSVASTVGPRSV